MAWINDLEEFLLDTVFKLVADKSIGDVFDHVTTDIDAEKRKKILSIKQITIDSISIDDEENRHICKAFMTAYLEAEENLKQKKKEFEELTFATPSLKEINIKISDLYSLHRSDQTILAGGYLANEIRRKFVRDIPTEFAKIEEEKEFRKQEQKRTKQQYFDF